MTLARNRQIEIDGERPRVVSLGGGPTARFRETQEPLRHVSVVELTVSAYATTTLDRFAMVDADTAKSIIRRKLVAEISEALAAGRVSQFRPFTPAYDAGMVRASAEIDVLRLKVAMLEEELRRLRP